MTEEPTTEGLVEDFLEEFRRGDVPDEDSFIAAHPKQAGELRDLLPENNPRGLPVPQILCNRAEPFLTLSRELAAMGYEELNLNAGCPSGTVVPKHKGAGLLLDLDSFDRMLADIFAVKEDFFQRQMAGLGYFLGKFIYMMDAAIDYEDDRKKGCYNPLNGMNVTPEEALDILRQPMGQAAVTFETLPLIQDANLMRNILYSGVWQTYNYQMKKKNETANAADVENEGGGKDGH